MYSRALRAFLLYVSRALNALVSHVLHALHTLRVSCFRASRIISALVAQCIMPCVFFWSLCLALCSCVPRSSFASDVWSLACSFTAWKASKYGVFSGLYFPAFRLNTGKYGPEKNPYLDTFHTVICIHAHMHSCAFDAWALCVFTAWAKANHCNMNAIRMLIIVMLLQWLLRISDKSLQDSLTSLY